MAADSHADPQDVRMRGFARRSTVQEAWDWLQKQLHQNQRSVENVSLWQAAGRVLAEDVIATVDVPSFDRSMMDGYALQAADTLGAGPYSPLPLAIIGQSLPGAAFESTVGRGQAVSIMTGAPLPQGADAVLPAERVHRTGDQLSALDEVPPQKNVGFAGEDITAGTGVLAAGRRLRPQDVAVLSSLGISEVPVYRKPSVKLIITGNELLPAGSAPEPQRIVDANGPLLHALVQRDGGVPFFHSQECEVYLTRDDPAIILSALQDPAADVLLISGGSSVGQEDHAPVLLAQHGELAIHGIAMRPSSPAGMGKLGDKLVFLLPGNPVSCLCAYDFFAGRAIRQLGGLAWGWPYPHRRLPLKSKLVSVVGRVDYARVKIVNRQVEPLAISGAAILSSTTRGDGFVVIPADSEGFPPGAEVDVFLYDHTGIIEGDKLP
jgi:molybdopterin molybdotransferase